MPIINRDQDITQQKEWVQWNNDYAVGVSALVQTGQTLLVAGPMPFPGRLQTGLIFATGCSGSMQLSLSYQRFVPGATAAGFTNITVGLSNVVIQNASVSGTIGFSGLPVQGSTILNFLTGDMLMVTTSGANTAVSSLAIQFVVIKTQAIVTHNALNI